MPCNLAVTITKAAVLPEHLLSLMPVETVQQIVTSYLSKHSVFKDYLPIRSNIRGDTVTFYLNSLAYRVRITKGQVDIIFPRYARDKAVKLSEELATLLQKGADRLFALEVQQSLTAKFKQVQTQTATVDNQGTAQNVTVFTLEL